MVFFVAQFNNSGFPCRIWKTHLRHLASHVASCTCQQTCVFRPFFLGPKMMGKWTELNNADWLVVSTRLNIKRTYGPANCGLFLKVTSGYFHLPFWHLQNSFNQANWHVVRFHGCCWDPFWIKYESNGLVIFHRERWKPSIFETTT